MPRFLGTLVLGVLAVSWTQSSWAEDVSFSAQIVPILKTRCVACHLTGEEQGEMALHPKAAYGYLVDVPSIESDLKRVEPSSPENSYLFHKLMGTQEDIGGFGEPMPMETWPLPDEQIELIRLWIEQGAKDN